MEGSIVARAINQSNIITFVRSSVNPPYNFTSVTGDAEEGGGELHLTGLRPYTRYTLVVQAYNQVGPGPLSEPLSVQTLEDGEFDFNGISRFVFFFFLLRVCVKETFNDNFFSLFFEIKFNSSFPLTDV